MNKPSNFYVFDLETYPNCFLFTGKFDGSTSIDVFEISDRRNDREKILSTLKSLQSNNILMIGYNNIGFDYPIVHEFLISPFIFDAVKAHRLATDIISRQDYGFTHIPYKDRLIGQIDLAKINHFDNKARRTSLKSLQFTMRSESVEDLPFPIGHLTYNQMDTLIQYNIHDVTETEKFLNKCRHLIEMRQDLISNSVLSGDVLNYSDVKIGEQYLISRIGRNKCYTKDGKPIQTLRDEIKFSTIILPKIEYMTEQFESVLSWFKSQTLWVKGEERPSLQAELAGLQFHFGVGGVHASVESKVYRQTDNHRIIDLDVSGMYVAVAIANGFYPEHLGQTFVEAYKSLQSDRKKHPKGSTMNKILKLAGNGAYGKSNDPYSSFYDPKYTYSVTVNGQLQLLQMVEMLSLIPRLELIQANTDGVTVYLPKESEPFFYFWKEEWQRMTLLQLEQVEYESMWIRDVNNYLALTVDGKVKRKGAYWYPTDDSEYEGYWNKDYSFMVVPKCIEQVLMNKWNPSDVLKLMCDPYDFMGRYKTPSGAKVYIGDKEAPKTVRYYISNDGETMKKIASPKGQPDTYKRRSKLTDEYFQKILSEIPDGSWDERIHTKNKSKYQDVTTSIEAGWLVRNCNRIESFNWEDVNYDYYVKEIEKLII